MTRAFRCALILMALLLSHGTAFAQATRTWVSGVGDDANPCSRTAPCKTFAGAISKTAAGGVINVLDPGGFGIVTITKSITIDGGGIEGSILASLTTGVIVNAAASDHVYLRNLTIYGGGNGTQGIRVTGSSGHVSVERVTVSGFNTGIDFNSTGKLYVYDSFFGDNGAFGILLRQGGGVVDGVRFDNNLYDGIRVTNGGSAVVRRSTASGHTNVAFSSVGAGSTLSMEDCVSTNNAYGIGSMLGASMSVSNTTVASNTVQGAYYDASSTLVSFGNNRMYGNATNGSFSSTASVQ
jgi:hypothetical protein